MAEDGTEIIIKSGSVEIDFDQVLYKQKNGSPRIRENRDRKITQILVVDENSGEQMYDSGDLQSNRKCKVTISTK